MSQGNRQLPTPKGELERQSVPTISVFQSISQILQWLHERAWPLSGFLLLVSILALRNYLTAESVPVGIYSSAFITALPGVLAYAGFICLLLLAFWLAPIWIFFAPLKDEHCMADRMQLAKRRSVGHGTETPIPDQVPIPTRSLPLKWVGGNVSIALFFMLASIGMDGWSHMGWTFAGLLAATAALMILMMIWMTDSKILFLSRQHLTSKFNEAAVMSALLQIILFLAGALIISRLLTSHRNNIFNFICSWLVFILILSSVQYLAVMFYRAMRLDDKQSAWIAHTATAASAIIIFALILPVTSPFLIRIAIQSGIHANANCLELRYAIGTTEKYGLLADRKSSSFAPRAPTKVRILFDTGDWLYVRAMAADQDQTLTWRIATADVVASRPCAPQK